MDTNVPVLPVLPADWQAPSGVHALTTLRYGAGGSVAPFDQFNMGNRYAADGDDPAQVQRNRDLLVPGLGLPSTPHWLRQVHGTAVLRFDAPPRAAGIDAEPTADAAVTSATGVVLAILLKERPGAHVWLIDSLGKRCRFLQTIVDTLDLPATVVNGRAEEQAITVDVVTARAVAAMEKLLGYAQPYFQRGAKGLFLKGEKAEAELKEARRVWQFEAELTVSRSDPRGRIVSLGGLRRVR